MGDCPKCGFAGPGAVDFCPNPRCRAYLGWASAVAPPSSITQRPPTGAQLVGAASPHSAGGPPTIQLPAVPEPPPGSAQKRGVQITIEPPELHVSPGSEVTTTVTVRNLGTRVEEFRLRSRGPAAQFASLTPTTLPVYPGDEQRAVARFAPARRPDSAAGVALFEIVARSAIHADVEDVARGRLTIAPFENLSADLTPEISTGRKPGRHQVSVTNGGNLPVDTRLTVRGQDDELTFEPQGAAAMLLPGDTQHFPVLVNGRRRWFGRPERLPFAVLVTPASPQPPITLNGTRRQTAIFPWWVPTAALAVIAAGIALFAVLKPGAPKVPVLGPVDEVTAVQQLKNAGYHPDPIMVRDNDIATGLTIRTDPAGGSSLPAGEQVRLYISAGRCDGPCPVEVPSVVGLSLTEAQSKLHERGFAVRITKIAGDRPLDEVTASDPNAATLRPLGSEVLLTVSLGPSPTVSTTVSTTLLPTVSPISNPLAPAPSNPAPVLIELPNLGTRSVQDATTALTELGLTAKTVTVHSNAVATGQVLSTTPPATSKVEPGSEVTVTVARNTAAADLIATAGQAAWKSAAGKLAFPGMDTDTTGFVLIRNPGVLEDGTTGKVLETSPQPFNNGFITGAYRLAEPVAPGDHVRARVGLLHGATGQVTFLVKANGKVIQQVPDTADGQLEDLDADLSSAQGATSIEITVLVDPTISARDWAVWQDLRLEPQVG